MSKGKRLIVTLMSSGMATAMSFVVSFFLTPFITNMLGTEAYGFVTLSKNFVSYAVIISTALDSYATRYIAMEYHKRDFDKANSYVSSAFYGDTIIASVILAIGVIFVLFIERFLNISPELIVSVKLLFLLVFVMIFWFCALVGFEDIFCLFFVWALTDSNRRPSACKADALNQLS